MRDDGRVSTAAITDVDDPPPLPVRPSVAVVAASATDDHPPQVRVTLANRGDETVTVGEGRAIVFAYVTDAAGELTLLPIDGSYPAAAGCWRLREPVAVTEEYRTVIPAPDDAVSRVGGVDGAAGGEGCLSTGTFRYETTYRVHAGGTPADDPEQSATWGLSPTLSRG